jgi:hypothetical protein
MGERTLRGSRLGAISYENDQNVDPVPRHNVRYVCPNGHQFDMPFAVEADVPATWECRSCGASALRVDAERPAAKVTKPARTHWDMLLERRSVDELEVILAERLEQLRSSRGEPAGRARRKKTA